MIEQKPTASPKRTFAGERHMGAIPHAAAPSPGRNAAPAKVGLDTRWLLSFVAKSVVLLGAFYALVQAAPDMPPLFVALLWALLSAIAAIGFVYHTTIRKTLKQFEFQAGGRLAKFNDGRCIAVLVGFVLSAVCTGSLIVEAPKWGAPEWAIVAASVPLYAGAHILAQRYLDREYAPLFRRSSAIRLSRVVVTVLAVAFFIAAVALAPAESYESIEDAFANAPQPYRDSPSAAMVEIGKMTSFVDGVTAYAMSEASHSSLITYFVIRAALVASAFFGIANLLSVCALDLHETMRTITPLSTEVAPKRKRPVKKCATALAVFLTVGIFCLFLLANQKTVEYENTHGSAIADAFLEEKKEIVTYIVDGHYVKDKFVRDSTAANNRVAEEVAHTLGDSQ